MDSYKESIYLSSKTSQTNVHPNIDLYENQNESNINKSRYCTTGTILGLFGIPVNPELFTDHLSTIIEGVIAVFGALTGLWAIFKDDEKES